MWYELSLLRKADCGCLKWVRLQRRAIFWTMIVAYHMKCDYIIPFWPYKTECWKLWFFQIVSVNALLYWKINAFFGQDSQTWSLCVHKLNENGKKLINRIFLDARFILSKLQPNICMDHIIISMNDCSAAAEAEIIDACMNDLSDECLFSPSCLSLAILQPFSSINSCINIIKLRYHKNKLQKQKL